MSAPPADPFRQEDLAARVDALRLECDALAGALARGRAEAAVYSPWSWRRFAGALVVTLAALLALFAGGHWVP